MEATVAEDCLLATAQRLHRRATGALFDSVEVTIGIISERLLDRPGQLPYAWKPRLSKTTSTVSLIRVPTSARGSPPRHTHRAHLRGYHITHAENFDQLEKEISAKLANLDDNMGFEVQEGPSRRTES